MKEQKKTSEVKSNVISGMSSTVGAAAGVVAGSVISSEVNAAETPVTPEEEQEVEVVGSQPSGTSGSTTHYNPIQASEPTHEPQQVVDSEPQQVADSEPQQVVDSEPEQVVDSEPQQVTDSESEQVVDSESEIEVIDYETVTNDDGSQMDVAVVNAQGQAAMIVDVDQDGIADVMAADFNGNGQIDDGEQVDITDRNIAMQQLHDAVNNMEVDGPIVQTNDTDYINDANVDEYIV